jgi:hypothetical protein
MLDFDKPLSEQHESVRNAISTLIKPKQHELGSSIYGRLAEKFTGDDFGMMRQGQQAASKALQDAGIPGIKYLDANSRTAGEGTLNFVPFNENLIRILERNSTPTGAQPWKPGEWQGLLGDDVPKIAAPQDEALRIAQRNAALPVSEGGLGLPADNTAMDRAKAMGFHDDLLVHFSKKGGDYKTLDAGMDATHPFGSVGTHIGTQGAAMDRFRDTVVESGKNVGASYPVKIYTGKPMLNKEGGAWDEVDLDYALNELSGYKWDVADPLGGIKDYPAMNRKLREKIFKEQGYSHIPYVNALEDQGSISYIVPPENIRSRFAAFDPMRRNEADIMGAVDYSLLPYLAGAGLLGAYSLDAMTDDK